MLLTLLSIFICVFTLWLFFKLFKIVLRFLFCVIIAALVGYLVSNYTPYALDYKWIAIAAVVLFIVSFIKSNSTEGLFSFWEDLIESRFFQIIIELLKIFLRFVIYMVLATLALHFIIKYTSYKIDSTSYIIVAIAMFILSITTSGVRKKSSATEYIYIERNEPKNYILNSNSGIIHSRWDSSADEISEEHQIPLSGSDAINLVRNDRSVRFKKDN